MLLDISEATTVGFAEMVDLGGDVAESGEFTIRAVAGAVASLVLIMANADEAKAIGVLPIVFGEMHRVAEERIRADHSNRSSVDVGERS